MGFTIEDMLVVSQDRYKMKMVAGSRGWSNSISWLLVMEEMTIIHNFSGKELCITTGLGFQAERDMLELVEELYTHNASGLIVNTGYYVKEIPQSVIDYCDTNGFPLLTVPWEVFLVDMIKDLSVRIFLQSSTDEQISDALIHAIEQPEARDLYTRDLLPHFDLDGTLTQSEFGIVDSVTYALRKFGIEGESREKLKQFIGPALFESFQNLYHFNKEDADRAVVYYREFYEAEGIYMSPLYDGVEKMLRDLDEKGKELYVVTAKPQEMAEKVLRHTGILGYFQGVIGPDRSARKTDKASLIRRAFELLSKEADNIDRIAEQSLMVGDRHYDMEGAAEAGVDSMGVLYGYGSRQELCWSGASYLAETPPEVTEMICSF